MPCPESLFGSASTAVGAICALAASIKDLKAHATMGEVAAVIAATEAASPVAAIIYKAGEVFLGCLASFYLGACIGSLSVATGRSLSGGMSISDLFDCAKSHAIPTSPELQKTLIAYPEICNADLRGSARIAVRKAQWSKMAVA